MKKLNVDEIKKMILQSTRVEHKTEDETRIIAVYFQTPNGREFPIEFDLVVGEDITIGDKDFPTLNDTVFECIDRDIQFEGLDFALAHKEVMKEDEDWILRYLKFIK